MVVSNLSYSSLTKLAIPIAIGGLTVPLLGVVDTAVVGRLGHASAIGAVGMGALIFNFVFWLFGFLRMVTTGVTAQALGQSEVGGDQREVTDVLYRTGLVALGGGLLILALQIPIGWLCFKILSLDGDLRSLTQTYYGIRIWAAPATLLGFGLLGWLIGMQRMREVLVLQLFLNLLNIALNLLFVWGFGWGVAGVAIASLVAEYAAAGVGIIIVLRAYPHQLKGLWARVSWAKLKPLFIANGNVLLRTLFMQIAFATISMRGERLGVDVLAANIILMHFYIFQGYIVDGMAFVAETVTGQALGRRDGKAYRIAFWRTLQLSIAGSLLIAAAYWLLGMPIARTMTDLDGVLATVALHLPLMVLTCALSGPTMQLDGLFIGATRTAEMRDAMLVALGLFFAALWLFSGLGNSGLWLAFAVFIVGRCAAQALWVPSLFRQADGAMTKRAA